jgi:ABC-type multidrug transport system permease subunit
MSSLFSDFSIAIAVSVSFALIWMISCGFFIDMYHFPVFMRWIQWTSPLKYQFDSLIEIQFPEDHDNDIFFNIAILFVFGLIFRFGTYLVLRKKIG